MVAKISASALWCALATQKMRVNRTPQYGRLLVRDSFYLRHTLARQMNALNDWGVFVLSTAKINLMNERNRPEAVKYLRGAERGSWLLYGAFKFPAEQNGEPTIATRKRFILVKDRSAATLFTNYLFKIAA